MKTNLLLFLFLLGLLAASRLTAQPLSGAWRGALISPQNPSMSIPTTLTTRVTGSQLTGDILMQSTGTTDSYTLQGTVQGNQVAGTATYPADGTLFQFEALLANGQLTVAFGQNGVMFMKGTFTKGGSGGAARPANVPTTDRLPRNTRLIGVWAHTSSYRSGDFYGSTRTLLYFFPDGRLGSGGGSANASLDGAAGSSSVSSGATGVTLVPGAVWYNKGDQIWLHATQQQVPDEVWGRFVLTEDGRAMHLNRGRGNVLYERAN